MGRADTIHIITDGCKFRFFPQFPRLIAVQCKYRHASQRTHPGRVPVRATAASGQAAQTEGRVTWPGGGLVSQAPPRSRQLPTEANRDGLRRLPRAQVAMRLRKAELRVLRPSRRRVLLSGRL
jgi:hypothetical protein